MPDSGKEIWDESAIDSFYRREDARTVRECMDRLNGDYRTVLYLVYFEEVDGDGAAKIMGKSKSSLRISSTGRSRRLKPSSKGGLLL